MSKKKPNQTKDYFKYDDSVKLPTLSEFQDIIDPIINTVKIVPKIGPPEPILPDYLTELPSVSNPFSVIKCSKIQDLKEAENERKTFELNKKKDFPIDKTVSRDTRLIFNANYQTRKLKYDIDMEETMDEIENPKPPTSSFRSEVPPSKFISNYDFVVDKRKVCLLDLAVNIKEEQLSKLEEIIREEERYIKSENKRLEKEKEAHDHYLKTICQKTSDAIKIAEKETAKKNKVAEKVKRARYNMAHLNAECVKLEEEYLRLKTYKEFLKNCKKQQERKNALERSSLMNELKIDAILKEVEMDNSFPSYDDDDEFFEKINFRNKSRNNINKNEHNLINNNSEKELTSNINNSMKEQLNKLKLFILNDANQSNTEDIELITKESTVHTEENKEDKDGDSDDEVVYFESPQDLVNILSELEANNLSLIENVQEQEEMCDQMRQRIMLIKHDMSHQIHMIDQHIMREKNKIAELEDSIKCIKETENFLGTFDNLERYKKIFYFGDLDVKTPDEMMNYLHDKITILYNSVFEKVDSTKSNTIEMLKRIEMLVDSLYVELQSYGRPAILKAKKVVDERKREAARIRQKELCKEAEQMKIRKAMEKSKELPRYHRGRKIIYRSDPPREKVKEVKVNWDEVRQQEENAFFFS